MPRAPGKRAPRRAPYFAVRRSRVHGRGAFALRRIRKGTRLVEYLGERVSHREADRRYADRDSRDNHTFLFIVDARTVIDAGAGGNDARFINHSCNPNCETVIETKRVYIEATRTIEPGEELSYDYQLARSPDDPPDADQIYACRCGHPECRGSMLWPPIKKSAQAKRAGKRPAKTRADKRSTARARRAETTAGR